MQIKWEILRAKAKKKTIYQKNLEKILEKNYRNFNENTEKIRKKINIIDWIF